MTSRQLEVLLVMSWAAVFLASGIWRHVSGEPFPLPGLRQVAVAEWPGRLAQVAAVLGAATWLSIGPWQTRDRLLVFQGMAIALCLQGFLYIGVPFGLAFSCFAAVARHRASQA